MTDFNEQQINCKFCFELVKMFMEVHEMIKHGYGDHCIKHTHCYEWFNQFKDGHQSTGDILQLKQPSLSPDSARVAQACDNCVF